MGGHENDFQKKKNSSSQNKLPNVLVTDNEAIGFAK